jgi:hypothetical protein
MSGIAVRMMMAAAGAKKKPSAIGEAFGGGFYAGNIVDGGTEYYLIVAPKASGENPSREFRNTNTLSPDETVTLNNGPAATAAMTVSSHQAARFCAELTVEGFSDWYLPARDELELCYRNLKPTTRATSSVNRLQSNYTYPEGNDTSDDTMGVNRNSSPTGAAYAAEPPTQTSVTAFVTGEAEAFASAEYWSSSELSFQTAWIQDFRTGRQDSGLKDEPRYVRAVRRVPV